MRRALYWFFPEQASNLAGSVDAIYFALLALCGAVTLLVFALICFFCIRYRRGSAAPREKQHGRFAAFALETGWTVAPLVIFIAIFVWAGQVYFRMNRPPPNATEIYVVAKQWMWKVQHLDGRREINELHIPVGQPVKLLMTSQDVIHDFYVPAFRTKQDVLPGRYTVEWFTPTKPGIYHLFCAEYCGTNHSTMGGWVHVLEPAEHARWLSEGNTSTSLAAEGEREFRTLGCSGCHAPGSQIRAPLLDGIFNKPAPLADGRVVIADDQYLRDSILLPNKQIAAGYESVMPTYQSLISEEQLNALVAYLKSLSKGGKQ